MPAQRQWPEELRERAVQMVLDVRGREGKGRGEIARVGRRLGVRPEAVRTWILLHLLVPHLAGRRLPPRFFVQ